VEPDAHQPLLAVRCPTPRLESTYCGYGALA